MPTIPAAKKRRVALRALALLIVGLGISALVYVNEPAPDDDPFGYDLQNQKAYLLQMEKIGGKANVMATQFQEWFTGLWQGQQLAYTLAVLSATVAFLYWFIALHHVPAPSPPDKKAG